MGQTTAPGSISGLSSSASQNRGMGMTTRAWGGAGAGLGGDWGGGVGTLDGVWGSSIFFFTATKKISLFQKYPSRLHYLRGQHNPGL